MYQARFDRTAGGSSICRTVPVTRPAGPRAMVRSCRNAASDQTGLPRALRSAIEIRPSRLVGLGNNHDTSLAESGVTGALCACAVMPADWLAPVRSAAGSLTLRAMKLNAITPDDRENAHRYMTISPNPKHE